jgi:DNA-binding response OmpR family regulator
MNPQQQTTPQTSGRKILIVEDERFISELYVRALSKAGYEVSVASDGQKGLDLALTNQFDIILLDLMVPTMTGSEILKHLRQKPDLKSRIVITTNLEQRDEIRSNIEQQADAYIVKAEVTPRELVDFLNTIK